MKAVAATILIIAGAALAITQSVQYFWSQQQAEIASRGHFVHHAVGSPGLAAVGISFFVIGVFALAYTLKESYDTEVRQHAEKQPTKD